MNRRPPRGQSRRPASAKVSHSQIDALIRQGYGHLQSGRPDLAQPCFERVVAAVREHPEGRRGLAHVAMAKKDFTTAVNHLRRAVKKEPMRGELHGELGRALQLAGQIDEAFTAYERAAAIAPTYIQAWGGLAEIHERRGRLDDAHAALSRALDAEPDSSALAILMARLHQRQGHHDKAIESLHDVLGRTERPGLLAQSHILLGRSFDRTGRPEDGYEHVRRGKALLIDNTPDFASLCAKARAQDEHQASLFDALTPERIERWLARPIGQRHEVAFLIGFPRSGTTLMEQVLGAHPGVLATDETPFIAQLQREVRRLDPSRPDLLGTLDAGDDASIESLQRAYFQRVESLVGEPIGDRLVVDKMPLNLLAVPIIARVFPRARIIFANRDPRDIVVSCFMRLGERPDVDSAEFLSMDGCVDRYCRVMEMWRQFQDRCPLPVVRVRYEDVVADLAAQARRMTEFLDLPWDESVLRFHESRRGVYLSAPTHEDVGRPVYTRSLDRWRKYAFAFTPAHLARLAPFVQALGYDDAV